MTRGVCIAALSVSASVRCTAGRKCEHAVERERSIVDVFRSAARSQAPGKVPPRLHLPRWG